MKLSYVTLSPTFFINIVALLRAINNNIHFDLRYNLLYRLKTGEIVCYIKQLGGHQALIHREPTNSLKLVNQLTFLTRRFQPSHMACKPIRATAIKQHKILGHTGSNAIKQLPKHFDGTELTELTNKRAPLKIKYKTCLIIKHTQQIS